MTIQIRAGTVNEIDRPIGEWLFVDLGFSSKKKSCGVLKGEGQPYEVTFGELVTLAKHEAQRNVPSPLNLMIEAPLSVTFNKSGNPTGRACDYKDGEHRLWYTQSAPQMFLAAGYLLQALVACGIQRDVRLYEGFASFKLPRVKSSHTGDVKALRDAVWDPRNPERGEIFCPTELKRCKNDKLEPAFGFMGMDLGIPPVIRVIIRP